MNDPLAVIGEILGQPAGTMRSPANADYLCPFIDSRCIKRSHISGVPYPVCSIYQSARNQRLICMCPKRFYQAQIAQDVIKHCWRGETPKNPKVAYEVKMEDFGNVDMVVADVAPKTGKILEFVSVELQAVDCTGSVEPAYSAVINNVDGLAERPSYGINWANVRKRYIAQLITKGFFHHHWGTRMVSVVQTPLYDYLQSELGFDELDSKGNCNIVFLTYDFEPDPDADEEGSSRMVFRKAIGTSHSSLMSSALYKTPPSKDTFRERIAARLNP